MEISVCGDCVETPGWRYGGKMKLRRTVIMRGNMCDKMRRKVLNLFGHVACVSRGLLNRLVYVSEVEKIRDKGRPCTWLARLSRKGVEW